MRISPPRPGRRIAVLVATAAVVSAACSVSQAPGWTYAPAISAAPAGSAAASPAASPAASVTASAEPSSSPSGAPSGAVGAQLQLIAKDVAFDKHDLAATADQAFQIVLDNEDAGVPHDVWIKDASGTVVLQDEFFNGVDTKTFDVPALKAGTYTFYCSVHPIPAMTGTLTVH